jgi:transposase
MTRLTKEDLAQMDRRYLQALEHERLVEVACNLRDLAVEQVERLEQNSTNSSRPPSSDSPYQQGAEKGSAAKERKKQNPSVDNRSENDPGQVSIAAELPQPESAKRSPGKQVGAQGFWRSEPLIPIATVPHYPDHCSACNAPVQVPGEHPYMGYHVLELERTSSQIRICCAVHHYYAAVCD